MLQQALSMANSTIGSVFSLSYDEFSIEITKTNLTQFFKNYNSMANNSLTQ